MKRGTHNLGRNAYGELALIRIPESGPVRLQVGSIHVMLGEYQIALLKDVLS